jgi:hypothetical protein
MKASMTILIAGTTLALGLLAFPAVSLAGAQHQAALPTHGILVSGRTLAVLRFGATPADIRAAWGTSYRRCDWCTQTTWIYTYETKPVGAAVIFDKGNRVVAVFTLGTPFGWRTQKGLALGADIHTLVAMYPTPSMGYDDCVGYNALSTRQGNTVTSIYTQAENVYGFALTMAGASVCL